MEEKREIKQIKKYDKYGNLEYTIIPNYKTKEDFMTQTELKFYKFLIKVVLEIKERKNINLTIFTQVALNRILNVNNEREKRELFEKISRKSIDYVLFDEDKNRIYCCIELDDKTHKEDEKRIERDYLINKAFEYNIKLIHKEVSNYYNLEETIDEITSK